MIRPGSNRSLSAMLMVLGLLLACSEASQWPGSMEVRNGVEVLFNPSDPLLGEADVLSQLWTLPGSDWTNPSRVHVGSGFITVVDPPANRIHLVSEDGTPQPSLGRQGGGPGEFLRLLDAFPDGDRLVVLDGGRSSVEFLDLRGDYLGSMHIEGQAWDGFILGGGTLLVKGEFLSDPTEESFGDWVRIEEGSEPSRFTSHLQDPLPEEQGVRCSDLFPWAEGAARLRFTTPQIQLFDRMGVFVKETRVDLPVEVVSDSERETALSELQQTLADRGVPPEFMEQNLVVMEERWRVKCRFGPLRFDPYGRVAAFLEQNPDEFGSGPATLHLISHSGVYLAKKTLPTAWRDFALADGVVYALTRDPDTDLISLGAFRLDLPEGVFREADAVLEAARQWAGGDG